MAQDTDRDPPFRAANQTQALLKAGKAPSLEVEAASDASLVKKVRLAATSEGRVEITSQDKSSAGFHIKDFMGAEVRQTGKVGFDQAQTGISVLILYYGQVKKGNVKICEHLTYSRDAAVLEDFRKHCINLYYLLSTGEPFKEDVAARRRFLFFISPASGKGKALKHYDEFKKYFEYSAF